MVVRNEKGELIMLKSKIMECTSVLAAEMEAMVWGASIATSEGWRDVIWSSDSTTLMREINSSAGPDN